MHHQADRRINFHGIYNWFRVPSLLGAGVKRIDLSPINIQHCSWISVPSPLMKSWVDFLTFRLH